MRMFTLREQLGDGQWNDLLHTDSVTHITDFIRETDAYAADRPLQIVKYMDSEIVFADWWHGKWEWGADALTTDDMLTLTASVATTPEPPKGPPTREDKFLDLMKESGLDLDDDDLAQYEGGRYIVIVNDGDIGTFREADNLDDLAGCIGDLIGEAYAFGGWHDLEEKGMPSHDSCKWRVIVDAVGEGGLTTSGMFDCQT